jgi:O-antigen/teichoic acid export membrane protein
VSIIISRDPLFFGAVFFLDQPFNGCPQPSDMNKKNTKHQIVINTMTGWIAKGSRMAIALFMVPFLLKHLGKDGYGLIGLIGVIVSFSTVADLGLRQALGRELSEKVANQDEDGFRALSSTALVLYLGIATVLVTAGWIFTPWFATTFKVAEELRDSAIWMIRLYGSGSLLLSFITPVFTAGLQSFMRFDTINFVKTISGLGAGILLFVCISVFSISPLVVWAVVMFSVKLFDLLIMWIFYRRWCFSGKLGFQYLNWNELQPLFQLGGYMYVIQLTSTLAERSDPLIVSFFFGTAGVALYQSGLKLSQVLRPVVLTLSTQVHPLTTRFYVLNQQDKQRQILIAGTRYTLLLGVIFSVGILLFSERFCWLWLSNALGNDYMTVVNVMRLWALASIFDYAGAMHWPVLLGMKKMGFAMVILVPSAIFNILVSIYMVGCTDWGIPGVIVATIVTGLVRRPIVIWYVSKMTGLSIKKYISSSYVPPVILFVLLLLFYYILKLLTVQNWEMLILGMALFCAYGALILMVIERRLITGMWHQWRRQ